MSISTFTLIHVLISLVALGAGIAVLHGMLTSKALPGWTGLFLAATVLTSATGYFFRVKQILPSHVVGAISLAALALAIFALYEKRLAGRWRSVYVVTAIMALYLNAFVAVVQAFLKIPFLRALAPRQSDLPFIIAQLAVLGIFIALGVKAVRSFRPQQA